MFASAATDEDLNLEPPTDDGLGFWDLVAAIALGVLFGGTGVLAIVVLLVQIAGLA